jgi:Flp pilus assembly protein TadG
MRKSNRRNSFRNDERGVAAIEFAFVGPILIILMFAIVCYGGYFWIAHAVQQLANDSARAAISGLDDAERRALAQTSLSSGMVEYAYLNPSSAAVSVERSNQQLSIRVVYDASESGFWGMAKLVPMPSPQIERSAAVRLGGY